MNSSLLKIKILVVDDDSTSLAIIAAMLKEWRYEVATVKTPVDALSTLRAHPGIDLVVTDLHMPEMNGIELQRQINQEFKLPVIIMSADDKESVMLESLARGAVFFIVKPVKPDDLKNVWQYAIAAKKGKSVVTEGIGSTEGESSSAGKLSKGEITSVLSVNNAKRGSKRKESRKGKDDQEEEEEEEETASAPKKAKVVWTSSLHNQFLEALRHIGLEKAVPKKILEHMNVQGLTRENVASHLQKYRIFLKRVAERRCFSSKTLAERVLKSKFASGHPLLWKTAQEYSRLQEMQRMGGLAFRSGYGGSFSAHNAARLGSILFPNQNAPSRNSAQPHGYGQSSLLGNQADKRQVSGNTSTLYQGNRLGYAYGSNLSLNGSLSGGLINASNGLMNGANSMNTHKKQIQARPDFYDAGSSSEFRFGSPGLHTWNSTPGTGNIGSIGTSYPTLNSSCTNNDNYAGFRLTTDGQLFGTGQTRLNGSCGVMNGTCNQNLNFAAMGNQGFRFISQGGFSSTGLDGANRVSPTNTAANQQANISTLPGLGNRGVTEYNSDHMMNNVSNLENITLSQQPVDGYLSDLLLESNNNQFPNQQQVGGDGVQNPAFASSSLFPEIYPTLEDLNSDFSDLLTLEETAPRNEKDLGQVQKGNEELMNTNVGGGAYTFDESNRTNFNQNTIQQLRGGEHFTGSDQLSSVFPVNNAPASGDDSSDNQKWGDDFVDSLFSFGPHFE